MTRQKDTAYGIKRLKSKDARAAIIQKLSADFNLMPLVKDISHPGLPQRPSTLRRRLTDTFEIMKLSKSFATLPLILTKSRRSHDFLNASSLNISTSSRSTNSNLWMRTLPIQPQTHKEKPNEPLKLSFQTHWI